MNLIQTQTTELSELDSVGSSDLTPSEFGDELQEESDEEVAWVWSLHLTGLEWRMWTRLGNIVYSGAKVHASRMGSKTGNGSQELSTSVWHS